MVLHKLGPSGVTSVFVDRLAASERADLLGAIERHPAATSPRPVSSWPPRR